MLTYMRVCVKSPAPCFRQGMQRHGARVRSPSVIGQDEAALPARTLTGAVTRTLRAGTLAVSAWLLPAAPAAAHPHVWIVTKSQIIYMPDGRIAAIRHAWTFDEGFSAYLSQGLARNKGDVPTREEMKGLAKENVESLVESNYFTVAKANGKPIEVAPPSEYWMESDGKQLTFYYVLPLKTPAPGRLFALDVYDPSYFISFILADGDDAVTLKDAPKGCSVSFRRPKPIDDGSKQTSESFFTSLSASTDYGAQFSSRAIVACP